METRDSGIPKSSKSFSSTLLLSLFVGFLGAHRFYARRFVSGAIQLLLLMTMIGGFYFLGHNLEQDIRTSLGLLSHPGTLFEVGLALLSLLIVCSFWFAFDIFSVAFGSFKDGDARLITWRNPADGRNVPRPISAWVVSIFAVCSTIGILFLGSMGLAILQFRSLYEQAHKFDPKSEESQLEAARKLMEQDKLTEAEAHIQTVLKELNPNNEKAKKMLALVGKLKGLNSRLEKNKALLDYSLEEIKQVQQQKYETYEEKKKRIDEEFETKYHLSAWLQNRKQDQTDHLDENSAVASIYSTVSAEERLKKYDELRKKFPNSAEVPFAEAGELITLIDMNSPKLLMGDPPARYKVSQHLDDLVAKMKEVLSSSITKFPDDPRFKILQDQLSNYASAVSTEQKRNALREMSFHSSSLSTVYLQAQIQKNSPEKN